MRVVVPRTKGAGQRVVDRTSESVAAGVKRDRVRILKTAGRSRHHVFLAQAVCVRRLGVLDLRNTLLVPQATESPAADVL